MISYDVCQDTVLTFYNQGQMNSEQPNDKQYLVLKPSGGTWGLRLLYSFPLLCPPQRTDCSLWLFTIFQWSTILKIFNLIVECRDMLHYALAKINFFFHLHLVSLNVLTLFSFQLQMDANHLSLRALYLKNIKPENLLTEVFLLGLHVLLFS